MGLRWEQKKSSKHGTRHIGGIRYVSEWIVDDTYLGSLSTNNVKPDALIVLGRQQEECRIQSWRLVTLGRGAGGLLRPCRF